jgi:hypothetical protein
VEQGLCNPDRIPDNIEGRGDFEGIKNAWPLVERGGEARPDGDGDDSGRDMVSGACRKGGAKPGMRPDGGKEHVSRTRASGKGKEKNHRRYDGVQHIVRPWEPDMYRGFPVVG